MKIRDHAPMIARHIEEVPDTMLIREFTQNGIETPNTTSVHWGIGTAFGHEKLYVSNDGIGMSEDEFTSFISDISWTGNKTKHNYALNFGMGARIAALKTNPFGIIIQSVRDGVMRSAHLKKEHALKMDAIPDIETWPTDEPDGTTVFFLGKSAKHNTAKTPWQGANLKRVNFLGFSLFYRFWKSPEGIKITCDPALARSVKGKLANFRPATDFFASKNRTDQYEAVEIEGMRIHYALHKKGKHVREDAFGMTSRVAPFCAVVHDNEMYATREGHKWYGEEALHLGGINAIARDLSVVVELTNGQPVAPTSYRNELQWTERNQDRKVLDDRQNVRLRDFAEEVVINMPEWVQKLIRQATRSAFDEEQEKIIAELKQEWEDMLAEDGHKLKYDPEGKERGKGNMRKGKKKSPSPPNPNPWKPEGEGEGNDPMRREPDMKLANVKMLYEDEGELSKGLLRTMSMNRYPVVMQERVAGEQPNLYVNGDWGPFYNLYSRLHKDLGITKEQSPDFRSEFKHYLMAAVMRPTLRHYMMILFNEKTGKNWQTRDTQIAFKPAATSSSLNDYREFTKPIAKALTKKYSLKKAG